MAFWDFFWLMVWGFFFILYLMVLFQIVVDIFRDASMNGWAKAVWLVALFVVPAVTALVYVIIRGKSMTEREVAARSGSRGAADDYIRSLAPRSDPATQISTAKSLLDSGAISQAEYEQLKSKALA
ncbi:MAG TPA: SHOCT domain-containing protein [Propionicimonas sp.]|uniref:SHOCT domain-containing protein n=1 Tax=Propionicimonas sp. TaxID=1955623 RepID=UPI002F40E75B